MTPSELKFNVENRGTESHYFTRSAMKFFGDTMRNFGVVSAIVKAEYNTASDYVPEGVDTPVWVLYRKNPVKHGAAGVCAYFAKDDYRRVFSIKTDN